MKLSFQETQCFTNDNFEFSVNGKSDDHYEKLVKHTLGKNSRFLLLKLILKDHPACSADTQYHVMKVHGSVHAENIWLKSDFTEKDLSSWWTPHRISANNMPLHKRLLMVSLAALEMLSAG